MDRKNDIKVDSFIHLGNYYSLDRVTHGSEDYSMGYCLVEYNNELYLADTFEEEIHTDEGSNYNLSGMGKHDYVGDITEEIGIPWLEEGNTNISYRCIDGVKKIGENGQLSEVKDNELLKKLKKFVSFSMSTSAENYCEHDEYNEDSYSINPELEEVSGKVDIELEYDSVIVSKDNMPYGKINATLESKDGEIILNMNGKEYVLDRVSENAKENGSTSLNNTVINEEKRQELIAILTEQQKTIEAQEKELADLKSQRRSLNE